MKRSPPGPPPTHYEGCWRDHHGCAIERVELLERTLRGLGDELYGHAVAAGYLEHRTTVLRLTLQEARRRVGAL